MSSPAQTLMVERLAIPLGGTRAALVTISDGKSTSGRWFVSSEQSLSQDLTVPVQS